MATKARITAEDLWARGEGDLRSELVDGRIVEMAPPGASTAGSRAESTFCLRRTCGSTEGERCW